MTIKVWLDNVTQDAERRGLPALKPLLEALARATSALRTAEWNGDATGEHEDSSGPSGLNEHRLEQASERDQAGRDNGAARSLFRNDTPPSR